MARIDLYRILRIDLYRNYFEYIHWCSLCGIGQIAITRRNVMNNKVISIEIGLQATKICEVDYKKRNPHVYNCITFQTPENTVEDGYIRDKVKFVSILKEKIKEANIKSTKLVFTVASTKIANREVHIPLVKENRIQDVVNANAADYFPVDISEYIISYSVLEKIINKEERKLRLLVLAAPSNLIKNYYNIAEMLEYEIVSIDYFGNSIFQIAKKEVDRGTNLIIQLNEQTTLISIIKDNVLRLQRTISFGTSQILNVVINQDEFDIHNEKDALDLLYHNDFLNIRYHKQHSEVAATYSNAHNDYNQSFIEKDQNKQNTTQEIAETFRYLIDNIFRVIDYYITKDKENRIDVIYFTGQGSKFKGVDLYIRRKTDIEVKRMEKLYSVIFHKNFNNKEMDQSEYLSCIGAAMNPINFVPKDYLVDEEGNTNTIGLRIMFAGSLILSIFLIGIAVQSYLHAKNENTRLTDSIQQISNLKSIREENLLIKDQYNKVLMMYEMTRTPNEKLNDLIRELELKMPTKAFFESLISNKSGITLKIRTDSKEAAAKVLQQLKTFDDLIQVKTYEKSDTEIVNGISTVSFVVTCDYKMENLQEENHESNQELN